MTVTQKQVRYNRPRQYLAKDWDQFRSSLTQYARTYFSPEKINDFSETGLGGMFIELAAYVGDNLSYYLDHQFSELNIDTAVENSNIEQHLRAAGVDIVGASPAIVSLTFAFELDAERVGSSYRPDITQLPVVLAGTICEANNGTSFELLEDIDFRIKRTTGELDANVIVSAVRSDGSPLRYVLSKSGNAVSGFRTVQTFQIPAQYRAFRTITLNNPNVNEIISVKDSEGNIYYEVTSLSQDTVYVKTANVGIDSENTPDNIEVRPAPYRFVKETSLGGRITTIRFGSGEGLSYDVDNVPDPSQLSIPLYGKKTFPRFTLDPAAILRSRTLGIAPINTVITVDYRHGGGLTHNVAAGSIRNITELLLQFPNLPNSADAARIRGNAGVVNLRASVGGDSAPSIQDLKSRVFAYKNAQSRIVSAPDLLSRIYTLPSNFGRVFRAGVRSNPLNPLATQLHIICRDSTGRLVPASDTLKLNIRKYLNPFRIISDAIEVLDAQIVNIRFEYQVVTTPTANKQLVIQTINSKLKQFLDVQQRQIDQPISLGDIRNLIFNTEGVVSVTIINVKNIAGIVGTQRYSSVRYDIIYNTVKDHIFPPPGGMFEVRFPDVDIVGGAI